MSRVWGGSALRSAGVRVGGAVLVILGLVMGIRILGPEQFGVSVLVLSAGQLIAFPMTAMERLVIRYLSQGQSGAAEAVLRRGRRLSFIILMGGLITAAAVTWGTTPVNGIAVFAAAVAAVSAGHVTLQQGACRAAGRLAWGQVPNEIVRPAATIAAYPVAASISSSTSGSVSVLIASFVVLVVMLFSPSVTGDAQEVATIGKPWGKSAVSLLVISAVALLIERVYPLVLGWADQPSQVAIFAVVLRTIQMANFSQAFAVFYFSPAVARQLAHAESTVPQIDSRLTSRIRMVGLISSVPAALLCLLAPSLLEQIVGSGLSLSAELRVASLAIVATALNGPAQTLLIMGGREKEVAVAYVMGGAASMAPFVISGSATAVTATLAVSISAMVWSLIQAVMVRRYFQRWV